MYNKDEFFFTDFDEADFDEIQSLWVLTGMGGPERKDNADTIRRCNSLGGNFIAMKKKGSNEIVGTSWLTFDGRRVFLHHFGIKPNWQGKGLAKLLAEKTTEFIKSIGAQVKLEVHKDNIKAKNIYKEMGFSAFDDYELHMLRDF